MKKTKILSLLLSTSLSVGLMSCDRTEIIEPTPQNCKDDTTLTNGVSGSTLFQSGVNKATTDNKNEYNRGLNDGKSATTYASGVKDGQAKIYKEKYDAYYTIEYKKAYDPAFKEGEADPTAETKGKADGAKNGKNDALAKGTSDGKSAAEADAKYDANYYAQTPATNLGKSNGSKDGAADGILQGNAQGKSDGYNDGYDDGNYDGKYDGNIDGKAYCASLNSTNKAAKVIYSNERLLKECENVGYKSIVDLQGNYKAGYTIGSLDKTEYNKGYAVGYADQTQIELGVNNGSADGKAKGYIDGKAAGFNKSYTAAYNKEYTKEYNANYQTAKNAAYNASYSGYYTSYYNSYYTYYYNLAYTNAYNTQLDIFFKQYYKTAYNDYYKAGYNDGYADGYDDAYYAWIDSSTCKGNIQGGRIAAATPRQTAKLKKDFSKTEVTVKDGVARYSVQTLLTFSKMGAKGIVLNNTSPETIKATAEAIQKTIKKSLTEAEMISLSKDILEIRRESATENQTLRLEKIAAKDRESGIMTGEYSKPYTSLEKSISTKSYKFSWEK